MHDLLPAAAVTVAPSGLLLAVAWVLRGQCTPRAWAPTTAPASAIIARLAKEIAEKRIPADMWGGVHRPHVWTVLPSQELLPLWVVEQARALMPMSVVAQASEQAGAAA